MNNKLIAFEYIISQLINWFVELKECTEDQALQEFNKLKIFKLHFFVSAIDTKEKNNTNPDLLDTFNEFWALPYGPVESFVYNHLKDLHIYSITSGPIAKKNEIGIYFDDMDLTTKTYIDKSIEQLRKKNEEIVTYPAFDLVELSHQWPVWRLLYNRALRQGKRSSEMPSELIRASTKIFR